MCPHSGGAGRAEEVGGRGWRTVPGHT